MLKGIDISNWQSELDIKAILPQVDFVICKATEGTGFVDKYCDSWIQECIQNNKLWGFYHFAGNGTASDEAEYFMANCEGYFNKGIPILDWEGSQSAKWVNEFVNIVHDRKGIWPWVYANPSRFSYNAVESNCARWIASYPNYESPSFDTAMTWDCPSAYGNVVAWQFCSDGRLQGYSGNLDCNLYYGDESSWKKYAGYKEDTPANQNSVNSSTIENDEYKITIERKS